MSRLVRKWTDKIEKGKRAKKTWSNTFRIPDLDKYWEGFQRPSWWQENTFIPLNLIYANIKSQVDSLASIVPQFHIRPSRTYRPSPERLMLLEKQAKLREMILNYLIRENQVNKEFRKTYLDAFVYFGVCKIFYEPIQGENPERDKPFKDALGRPLINPETGEPELQPDTILIGERFRIERRDPKNILFDPWADSIENITWVAERIEYTVEEVKNNPLYKNTSNIKPYTQRTVENDRERKEEQERKVGDIARSTIFGREDRKDLEREDIVVVWEIYDISKGKMVAIAEGHDLPLMNEDIPRSIEKHPYVFLFFTPRRNSPYPIPEIWHQLGPQDEYNITRNQIITHRKRFTRKYEMLEGAITDDELAKLEEPYDGMVIKKQKEGKALTAIEDPGLDQAVYFDVEMLRRDFFDIAGIVQEGEISKIEKATTASIVNERIESKRRGKRLLVKEFLEEVGRKLMLLITNEIEIPQAISITGPSGMEWQLIHPDELRGGQGEFLYEISTSSLIPRSPVNEREQWLAFLQVVNMNPHIATSEVLIRKTAELFQFEDQLMIDELIRIGQQMLQERMLSGGQPGQPSPPASRPVEVS